MDCGERFFMKEAKERGRPPEVDVEAQPGAAEAEQGESEGGKTGPERALRPRLRYEGALREGV